MFKYITIAIIGLLIGVGIGYLWQQDAIAKLNKDLTTIEATAKEAQRTADDKFKRYQDAKEKTDAEYETALAKLRDDNKRLRNKRAGSNYVPAAPTASVRPDLACFAREDLERAIRRFDAGVTAIVGKGDENTLELDSAKFWGMRVNP